MSLIAEVKISMFGQKNTHTYLTSDQIEDPYSEVP
jgi:hypothetical protein